VQGSVWMGMGRRCARDALPRRAPLAANFIDYRIPTIAESPPIETYIVEAPDPHGPFGAKEAGEGSLSGFIPALTNAIAAATGLRLTALPASPDRLLDALQARARKQRLTQALAEARQTGGRDMERLARSRCTGRARPRRPPRCSPALTARR